MSNEKQIVEILDLVIPIIGIICVIIIIVSVYLFIKKNKFNFVYSVLSIFLIITFVALLNYNEGLKRKILIFDSFFDGKGTPIEDIAEGYADKLPN